MDADGSVLNAWMHGMGSKVGSATHRSHTFPHFTSKSGTLYFVGVGIWSIHWCILKPYIGHDCHMCKQQQVRLLSG